MELSAMTHGSLQVEITKTFMVMHSHQTCLVRSPNPGTFTPWCGLFGSVWTVGLWCGSKNCTMVRLIEVVLVRYQVMSRVDHFGCEPLITESAPLRSPLLFNLALQPLAIALKQNNEILGNSGTASPQSFVLRRRPFVIYITPWKFNSKVPGHNLTI